MIKVKFRKFITSVEVLPYVMFEVHVSLACD